MNHSSEVISTSTFLNDSLNEVKNDSLESEVVSTSTSLNESSNDDTNENDSLELIFTIPNEEKRIELLSKIELIEIHKNALYDLIMDNKLDIDLFEHLFCEPLYVYYKHLIRKYKKYMSKDKFRAIQSEVCEFKF